jgi:hypothetical protein
MKRRRKNKLRNTGNITEASTVTEPLDLVINGLILYTTLIS